MPGLWQSVGYSSRNQGCRAPAYSAVFLCVCWPPKRQCSICTTSSQHGSTSCLPGNVLARVTILTTVEDTAYSRRARVSHNIRNRLESLDCVWVEACGDCAFCCRRVLWREHTSSPRGATPVGVSFLLEVCLLYTSPSPRDKRQSRMPSSA